MCNPEKGRCSALHEAAQADRRVLPARARAKKSKERLEKWMKAFVKLHENEPISKKKSAPKEIWTKAYDWSQFMEENSGYEWVPKMVRRLGVIYHIPEQKSGKAILVFDEGRADGEVQVYEHTKTIPLADVEKQIMLTPKDTRDKMVKKWVKKKFGAPTSWKQIP